MSQHPCFGLPAAAGRGREPLLPGQPVLIACWTAPAAFASGPAHPPARLHCRLDMGGRFDHQVQHGLLGADHAVPLKLGARISPDHQGLIVRLLLIGQVHVEQAQLISLRMGLAHFEQGSGLGRRTGHQRDAPPIDHWNTHREGFPLSWSEPGCNNPSRVQARRSSRKNIGVGAARGGTDEGGVHSLL